MNPVYKITFLGTIFEVHNVKDLRIAFGCIAEGSIIFYSVMHGESRHDLEQGIRSWLKLVAKAAA
jgi:hypothetical protein